MGESWTLKKTECWRIDAFELWCWRISSESFGQQGDPTSPSYRKSILNIHWKDWWLSWNSNTLATWCEELTHWKRPWCWERLKAEGEENNRVWDSWVASPTQWTWVWVSCGSWWWTCRPGMLQSMGLQRVRHGWVTELKWYSRGKDYTGEGELEGGSDRNHLISTYSPTLVILIPLSWKLYSPPPGTCKIQSITSTDQSPLSPHLNHVLM